MVVVVHVIILGWGRIIFFFHFVRYYDRADNVVMVIDDTSTQIGSDKNPDGDLNL